MPPLALDSMASFENGGGMTKNSLLRRLSRRASERGRSAETFWTPRDLYGLEDRDATRAGSDLLAARDRSSWT